jgi:uncharacterized membrane protein YphA (DoxX/SURF4 family)
MSIPILILQVVLGLLFVAIGSMTVAGRQMFVENFRRFGYPQWFRIVTGSLEVLGVYDVHEVRQVTTRPLVNVDEIEKRSR